MLQPRGSSNSPIHWLQPEGGYNPLCSSATTRRWLQPPFLAPSNLPDTEVEWWNHYHIITVRYTAINLYHKKVHQPCTNLCLNLYHQRVHQPCTKYVPIMHQIHINYDSSRCTNIINNTPHVCVNSSTTCLNHVPNMYLNKNLSSISSSKYDL